MPRILLVDDDTAVRTAIQTLLEYHGHEVVAAESGRKGLSAIERERFDVVICDIFMPGMDGLEAIRAFQQRDPDVPVIAMSGFMFRDTGVPAPDFLSMSTKLGAAYSLQKPFKPSELKDAVEICLARSRRQPTELKVS